MPILPGDELTGDCQYVGNTPVQPHKAASDGTLARATEADLDAAGSDVDVIRTGMVIKASRKQAYIDAYAALGLGVCDEDDAPFAAENAPLMIRFQLAGLQVWLTGRDFIDYSGQLSDPEYWQLAFDEVVDYAANHVPASRTKVVLLLDSLSADGTFDALLNDLFPNCSTLPAGWTLHLLDENDPGGTQVTDYFAGGTTGFYGGAVSPDDTAVLIVSGAYVGNDLTYNLMGTLAANAATFLSLLRDGGGLLGWSQSFTDDDPEESNRGDPQVTGWSWLDNVFPGMYAVGLGTYPSPYVPTAAGEARIPGMTASINYDSPQDTAQSAFAGDLNGLVVLTQTQSSNGGLGTPGVYDVEIGGVPNL